jgi:hypothetical protein
LIVSALSAKKKNSLNLIDMEKKTRHHLRNKSRGGQSIQSNILILDEDRHRAWHILFKNLDLDQVIALLERTRQAKRSQKKWLKK